MHSIPQNSLFDTLQRGEKIFLETWFNLTHAQSLDSYRVRCHNGRTILEELKREMGISVAKDADLAVVAAEAQVLGSGDPVLQKVLGPTWQRLQPLLGSLAKAKAKSQKKEQDDSKEDEAEKEKAGRTRAQLSYVLTDVLPHLPTRYLTELIKALEVAIKAADEDHILRYCGSLASDLIAHGWAVASLHTWVETHFLSQSWASLPFDDRLKFFADRMQQAKKAYEVVFVLSGSNDIATLGQFCGVAFSATPPEFSSKDLRSARNFEKFLRENPQRAFATVIVDAVDQFSAIHEAEEKLAKCQDRLRFNFISIPLERWQRVLVTIRGDQSVKTAKLLSAQASIPSPAHHLKLDAFLQDSTKLDSLFASGQIDDPSRRRIEAAIRHYRLGLDARSYHDMLLNWWMGLETLTNTGGDGRGGIGGKVLTNGVPLLCHRYLAMQLRYLCGVVQATCGEWPPEVTTMLGEAPQKYLTAAQLVQALQTPAVADAIKVKVAARPWVELRWERFRLLVNDAPKLAAYLDDHETRVRWHLQRLYRMRCCLVHGTPVVTPLQLPTANLEYYLREAIYVVIEALEGASQIRSLEAVYDRTGLCASRRKEILHTKNLPAADAVRGAMQSGITFQLSC